MVGPIRASALCLAVFVAALIGEHLLEPSLSPLQSVISEYARTGTGEVMRCGLAAWALSLLCLGVVQWHGGRRVQAAGMALAAGGCVLVVAFTTQAVAARVPAGVERTLEGRLHDLGGELLIVGLLVAVVVGALRGPRSTWSRAVVVVAIVVSVGLLLVGDPAPGLRQRALVLCAIVWQAIALYLGLKQRGFSMQYQLIPEQLSAQPVNGGSPGLTSSTSLSRTRNGLRSKSARSAATSRGATGTSCTPSTDTS
jgi:hypothetical protein